MTAPRMTAIAVAAAASYTIAMPQLPDLDALAGRYLDLWNDHLRAVAADPAWLHYWSSLIAMAGSGMAQPGVQPFPPGGVPWPFASSAQQVWPGFQPPAGMPGWPVAPVAPPPAAQPSGSGPHDDDGHGIGQPAPGPAAPAPLPDRGGPALDEFADKLALLAERLDSLERRLGGAGTNTSGRGRRRRS